MLNLSRPRLFCTASSAIAVRSPRDGKIFAELRDWSAAEADAAIAKAQLVAKSAWAQPKYAAVDSRATSLRALATSIRGNKESLARLESLDCGKPISESRVDMDSCADLFDYYAEVAPSILAEAPISLPDADFSSRVVPCPAGVVAAITPWNYPLMQAVCKVAPALAAGCPVLL